MAGTDVEDLFCGIAGEHVQTMTSKGIVAVSHDEITTSDVDRANEVARAQAIPPDRELLHAIPQEYTVDKNAGIRDPIGMTGTRLETEMYLVTIGSSPAINLRRSVERAGYKVRELVLEPLASALAVLTEDEKELGVALVEMGAARPTSPSSHEGKIRHLGTIAFGGNNVTRDIVHGLGVTQADAERLKERFGCGLRAARRSRRGDSAAEHGSAGRPAHSARAVGAHHPPANGRDIRSRAARHLGGRLRREAERRGGAHRRRGGDAGERRAGERCVRYRRPRRGASENIGGLVDSVEAPRFATVVGLAQYGANRVALGAVTTSARRTPIGKGMEKITSKLKFWLQDFF